MATSYLSIAVSALDSQKSLLPFFVKDTIDNTGRTLMAASEGGKHEAREKFIEETGTSIFWMGGIPAVRWAINKIAKAKNYVDPDIHFKRINTEGIQNYFANQVQENGKQKFSKKDLEGIVLGGEKLGEVQKKLTSKGFKVNLSKGTYKNYHKGITAASILINLFMLMVVLPKSNQLLSRKIISDEINGSNENQKSEQQPEQKLNEKSTQKFTSFRQASLEKSKQPSFGALKDLFNFKELVNITKMAEMSQLNTVNSMLLLDYGISGSRVTFIPRDNNERIEYAVKEAGIILFFYQAADWIKKGFQAIANKGFKTPIDLDYKIIADQEFANEMKKNTNKAETFKFAQGEDEVSVIKFIDNALSNVPKDTSKNKIFKNFTLQMAQKTGLIDLEYDDSIGKWIRHSKKYIETEKLVELNKNLKDFYEKALKHPDSEMLKVISKTKAAKSLSVLGNIAICSLSLSYLLPKLQYFIREHRTQTKSAPGIKLYQELAEKKELVI